MTAPESTKGDWLAGLQALLAPAGADGGAPGGGVLVTVVSVRGHAPREAGTKMVVTADATWDTIGGGNLEALAIDRARRWLQDDVDPALDTGGVGKADESDETGKAGKAGDTANSGDGSKRSTGRPGPRMFSVPLDDREPGEFGQQCCGGEVTLLLERFGAPRPTVAVFGVGHVGYALAGVLRSLPLDVVLVDSRPEQLSDDRMAALRGGAARFTARPVMVPEEALLELPAGGHAVIMTHDHAEDFALCDAALRRPDLGFVGVIGSATKWARFKTRLRGLGHADADISRLTCPIGVPGINGKTPEIIALSVAAQLQQQVEAAADGS